MIELPALPQPSLFKAQGYHNVRDVRFAVADLLRGQSLQFVRENQPLIGLVDKIVRDPAGLVLSGFIPARRDPKVRGHITPAPSSKVRYHGFYTLP